MKNNLSEKALYLITILLIVVTLFLSLSFPVKNSFCLFLLVFGIAYWQRKHLQIFFQKIKNPKTCYLIFILTGWLGAIFLEFSLGISPFHSNRLVNYLVGMGFYLPYFTFWLTFIKRYKFSFFEVFYLSGLGRLIFDLLVTRKLVVSAAVATSTLSAFFIFFIQAVIALTLFGVLTVLPVLYLSEQEEKCRNKPLMEYFVGLATNFLAAGVFVLWTIILKIAFR